MSKRSVSHRAVNSDGMSGSDIEALESRASCLINPASGIANDYLNVFNEALLLVENMPVLLPDMVAELLAWTPISYRDYFMKSRLPGRDKALAAYEALDPRFRREFESSIDDVIALAVEGIQRIKRHRRDDGEIVAEEIADYCEELAVSMRAALRVAEDLVNHGCAKRKESPLPSLRASA